MKENIVRIIREVAADAGLVLVPDITDKTVLLQSGIDSLGFAVLVARLEEEFGYDPFSLMDVPIYPRTLGEFVDIYQKFAS
jgi:hypothetical protein